MTPKDVAATQDWKSTSKKWDWRRDIGDLDKDEIQKTGAYYMKESRLRDIIRKILQNN